MTGHAASKKVYPDAAAALQGVVKDGMTLMCGGFGVCGIPENLIDALRDIGAKDLTVISNNAGLDGVGLGLLLQSRQIRKMISSYVGENKEFERQYLAGELEIEFNPQGTLAERIRAGGAGIYGVLHQNRRGHAGRARARKLAPSTARPTCSKTDWWPTWHWSKPGRAIREGNLIYRKTARNFNPNMATAAHVTLAEVEELVEPVDFGRRSTSTRPAFSCTASLQGTNYSKLIEKRTVRKRTEGSHAVVA